MNLSNAEYWDSKAEGRCRVRDGNLEVVGDAERWQVISETMRQFVREDDSILEIGPGSSPIALNIFKFMERRPNYASMDVSGKFAAWVTDQYSLPCINQSVTEGIPFDGNYFDQIWFFDVLEHIALAERFRVGMEVSRVLKKDGAVFINNPTFKSKHDQNFEWLLGDGDLLWMFPMFRIHQKQTYEIKGAQSEFIILTRRQKP